MSMQRPDPEATRALVQQYDRLVQQRAGHDRMWRELAQYMRPSRTAVLYPLTPGQKLTFQLYDGTAIKGAHDLASALAGSFTSSTFQWFALRMRQKELNDVHEVQVWLEECARRLFLAFQQSNFDSEVHEMYLDLVVFGTGCFYVEERRIKRNGFNGFVFRSFAPGTYVIIENAEGRVAKVMHLQRMSRIAMASEFGTANIHPKQLELLESKPEDPVEVLHVCQPNGEGWLAPLFLPRAYKSLWIDREHYHVMRSGGYFKNPFMVPRWTKANDEVYGRGQGDIALPDVRTLNTAVADRLKAWAKAIDPPLKVLDDGVVGRVRLTPGAQNVLRDMNALAPLEQGAKFDVASFQEEKLQQRIKEVFFSDRLNIPAKQYMTATEVSEQIEIMQRLLGPTLGRLTAEFLNHLIDVGFDKMYRAGALPPAPDIVMEAVQAGIGDIDVQYESPLTRSQRTADLVAIDRAIQSSAPFVQANPETLDNFDDDEHVRYIAEVAGVPAKLMRPIEEVMKRREQRAAVQAQQQQLMNKTAESQIIKNVTPAAQAIAQEATPGAVQPAGLPAR